jgi:spermidine/putrescine transport system permease protein
MSRPVSGRRSPTWLGVVPDWLITIALFVAPLGVLVAYSFGKQSALDFHISIDGSLRQYRLLLSRLYRPTFLRSFRLAALTSAACLAVALPLALAVVQLTARWRRIGLALVVFPSFVSFIVRTYAWVGLLGKGGQLGGLHLLYKPGGVAIGMVHAYLPLAFLPLYTSLERIAPSLQEAAADLGARPWQRLRTVTLPLAAPGIVVAVSLVGILAVGEFTTPAVLGGGKTLLLGNLLASQASGSNRPLGGAIATTLLAVFLVLGGAAALLYRRFSWVSDDVN